jgi:periplasmic protein TonB
MLAPRRRAGPERENSLGVALDVVRTAALDARRTRQERAPLRVGLALSVVVHAMLLLAIRIPPMPVSPPRPPLELALVQPAMPAPVAPAADPEPPTLLKPTPPRRVVPPRAPRPAVKERAPLRRPASPAAQPAADKPEPPPPVAAVPEPQQPVVAQTGDRAERPPTGAEHILPAVPDMAAAEHSLPAAPGTGPRAAEGSGGAARPRPASPPSFDAAYLRNPAPRYPLIARRNGEQGTVTLRVLVTREGLPGTVTLEKSSGSAALDSAALTTVKEWRFVPAQRNGRAVDASVLVPIVFRLQDAS